MTRIDKPKFVIDPLLGVIEISDVLPLIDTKEFQSLGFKYQLGFAYSVFPAATHTRKQHSLGAYERARRLTHDWLHNGFIDKDEAHALQVYALYHDIGHGPFSHVTEKLGKMDHDRRGLEMVKNLQSVIESVGCNYALVQDFFARKNPLYLGVFDKNFGMEKLDYMERDAFYTIGERPGVEYLAKHIYYIDKKVMVDEVALDQAKDIQDFYIKLYKNVYLRKKSSVLQRTVEKMTHELMKDGLTEAELFTLTDFGLLGRFEVSQNPSIRFYYERLMSGIVPKTTLEFKYESAGPTVDLSHKTMKVIGFSDEVFEKLAKRDSFNDVTALSELEVQIASLVGVSPRSIVLVPMFTRERFRFEPQDMDVYSREGRVTLLSKLYPDHFQAMREYGKAHLSLRVCAYNEDRRKLYDASEEVKQYLLSLIKN